MACWRHLHIGGLWCSDVLGVFVCVCACVPTHKIHMMNKAKSKWTVDDKKMQIIVPLGLQVELLTGDAEAMTDAHGRLRIGSYNLQKEIGTLCK